MERYCFAFGCLDICLIVVVSGYQDARQGFRERCPDVNSGTPGCSSGYSEKEWESAMKPYIECRFRRDCLVSGLLRCSTMISCEKRHSFSGLSSLRKKLEGYGDLFLYVPEARQIIRIAEGTGDNLLEEDIDAGYVDYIYYDQYLLDADMSNVDGGMLLLKEMLRDKYRCMADCIPDVLDMAYGNCLVGCMILG